jgi:hypothetical protein
MPNEPARRRVEAVTFGAYLGCPSVPADIVTRYDIAVADWPRAADDRFDAWLVRVGGRSRSLAALADAYARFARPYGGLRRRLTLMLALLETHGTTHHAYDRAQPSSPVVAWLALAMSAMGWGLRTILAVIICAPAHVIVSLSNPRRR